MARQKLLQLAQDLEWLGSEVEYYGSKHAGPDGDVFLEKQREVLTTADKIERELKGAIRFNPTRLVGVDFPLEASLDSITDLLAALEDIKQAAVFAVRELPPKVRSFTIMVQNHLNTAAPMAA